ncbi:MAG TPA: hypothetical protein VGC18_07580 [Lacisediminihabitans sp.]|uniref:hypothetical protein n=1 Tax=Lacisediminihabitans sp. TaxID=2787631 RepID=UPI002EDB378F
MTSSPQLGLLLDVDGPIASPVTRTINLQSIVDDLVALAGLGVPIAFNTGRSDVFIRDRVLKPMLAAGLSPDARVYGICEKGAVWFGATFASFSGVHVDESVKVPAAIVAELRALVADRFADTMFFDETKLAMVSVEQRTDVSSERYHEAQLDFDARAAEIFERHGVTGYRIDPTIISTDIEALALGKALGARRALELMADSGEIPRTWRTVGDSRSDYAMADYLHENGFEVAHLDVRPADGIPDKPYPVLTEGEAIHDEAGALFLSRWVRELSSVGSPG